MADYRTKRQKLEAMANQTESPQEAEVARKKLAAMASQETTWGASTDDILRETDDILREMNEQMAARMRGWFARQAKPSGYERQGARAEYLYADDLFTKEDLERARDSMLGKKPPQTQNQAQTQSEAMYNELRRKMDEAVKLDRDEWRRKYGRTPLFDQEEEEPFSEY